MLKYSLINLLFLDEIRNKIYQHLLSSFFLTNSNDHYYNICEILEIFKETRLKTRSIYYN